MGFDLGDPSTEADDSFTKWIMSSDYTTTTNQTIYDPDYQAVDLTQNSYSIGLRGIDNNTKIGFSFVSNKKGVFEVVASSMKDLTDPTADIRHNYMITFFDNYLVDSENVIVQR